MVDQMRYANADLEIRLPLGWQIAAEDEETTCFTAPDASASVTLGTFYLQPSLSRAVQLETFKELFAVRLQAEREMLAEGDPLVPGECIDKGSYAYAHFAGYERGRKRLFNGLSTLENLKVVTLYVESLDLKQEAHGELADLVFQSLEMK